MVLKDYKGVVGSTAAVVTVAQFFSPVFIIKDIIRQGNTNNVDPQPFIGGLGISVLNFVYGRLIDDPAMVPVNIFAFVLNIIYLAFYYAYTDKKAEVHSQLKKVILGCSVVLCYTYFENPDRIVFTYGIIITALMLALIGAPLLGLKDIIKNKSTGTLPFPMILSGTVVTSLWLLYGIILENPFIQFQNIVGLVLCGTQLSLFAIYPSKPVKKDKKTK